MNLLVPDLAYPVRPAIFIKSTKCGIKVLHIQKQPKRELVLVVNAVVLEYETEGTMTHANTGRKHSPETIKKIGWYWKGKHLSEEHKHKLSLSNRGHKVGCMKIC